MVVSSQSVVTLEPRPPFDFRLALAYLGRSPQEVLDVVKDGRYRRAVRLDGQPTLLEVQARGTVDRPALELRVLESKSAPQALPLAERLVADCFRLDQDSDGLAAVAAADPVLGSLLDRLRGARALVMPSPFEALIWAILGQQISVAFAYKLKRTLVERYGERITHDGRDYYCFPTAERLAELSPAVLRDLQFSRQKAEYVITLGRLMATGSIDWDGLRSAPTAEAVATLSALRGVGRWTAEYVCMRGLGHREVLPAADLGLRAVIGRAYALGRTATEQEVRRLAERWTGWESHAAFCWWYPLAPGLPPD